MSIKATVRGDGPPYAPCVLLVGDKPVSEHAEEREAIERGSEMLEANPGVPVRYERHLVVDLELVQPIAPEPEPEPEPPAPQEPPPDFEERWQYESTADMQANPRGHFIEDYNQPKGVGNAIELYPGGGGLLLTFGARTVNDGLGESMVGKNIRFPKSFGQPRELWLEVPGYFAPGWSTAFIGQTKQADHKFLFITHQGAGLRWELKPGFGGNQTKPTINGTLQDYTQKGPRTVPMARRPHTTGDPVPFSEVVARRTARYVLHLKMSSTPTTTDGAYELWVDGEKQFEQVGIYTGHDATSYFDGLALGRNLNQVPTQKQTFGFGPIRVWKQNPQPETYV